MTRRTNFSRRVPPWRLTLDLLVELLKRDLGPELHAVWLFGSRARGEEPRAESDVDLIVLTEGGWDHDQGG